MRRIAVWAFVLVLILGVPSADALLRDGYQLVTVSELLLQQVDENHD
jgi:hypothetical protein